MILFLCNFHVITAFNFKIKLILFWKCFLVKPYYNTCLIPCIKVFAQKYHTCEDMITCKKLLEQCPRYTLNFSWTTINKSKEIFSNIQSMPYKSLPIFFIQPSNLVDVPYKLIDVMLQNFYFFESQFLNAFVETCAVLRCTVGADDFDH